MRPISPPIDLPPTPPSRSASNFFTQSPLPQTELDDGGEEEEEEEDDDQEEEDSAGDELLEHHPSEMSTTGSLFPPIAAVVPQDEDEDEGDTGQLFLTSLENGHRSRQRRRRIINRRSEVAPDSLPSSIFSSSPHSGNTTHTTAPLNLLNNFVRRPQSAVDHQSSFQSNIARSERELISSSLRRRMLAMSSSDETDWRRRFLERMNRDFESGVDRASVVRQLRLEMNSLRNTSSGMPFRPPGEDPSVLISHLLSGANIRRGPQDSTGFGHRNLVSNLQQIRILRSQAGKKSTHGDTLLVYCGSPSEGQLLEIENGKQLPVQVGCGRLITIRSMRPNFPRPRYRMYDDPDSASDYTCLARRYQHNSAILISDTPPAPNSVEPVDAETQASFETDRSNPFYFDAGYRHFCECQRAYVGCLSWSECQDCQKLGPNYFNYNYYMNRVTTIPRYANTPISLNIQQSQPVPQSSQPVIRWVDIHRIKAQDYETGLVGRPEQEQVKMHSPASLGTISSTVRNMILADSPEETMGRQTLPSVAQMLEGAQPEEGNDGVPQQILHRNGAIRRNERYGEVKEEEVEEGFGAIGRRHRDAEGDEEEEDAQRSNRRRVGESNESGHLGGFSSDFSWTGEVCAR